MSDPRVTVDVLSRTDFSFKTTLTEAWGKQWQDVLNDTGFGKCVLQNDDESLPLVEYGDFLQFKLDGTPRFLSIVETIKKVQITADEEVGEVTEISGRGALAYLEDAVVYPDFYIFPNTSPFGDTRVFNFACFDAVGTVNQPPYDFGDRLAGAGPFGVYTNVPNDFPPVFSHWLGPEAPDGSGDNQAGDWYFMAIIFDLPAQLYRLYIGYDDAIDLWIDNVPILRNDGGAFLVCKTVDLFLDAYDPDTGTGIHFLNGRVTNRPLPPSPNPSGITMALCSLNPDGSPDVEYWATDPADPNFFVSAFPTIPPSFTPGFVADELCRYEPGQAERGALPLITMGFDADVDSNGDPWVERITPSFQIGTDCLTAIKQLAESYFDVRIDPVTFTLNLYQTFGSASGAEFEAGENITDLTHTGVF